MCLATLATIRRETNSARHTFMIAGSLFLAAYFFALIVYQISTRIFG